MMLEEWDVGLDFIVPGEPRAKERPRTVRIKKDSRVITFTPRTTADYEHRVRTYALRAMAVTKWRRPLHEDRFFVALTLHLETEHHKDCDNVLKSVLDGLVPVVLLDDWQVAAHFVERILKDPNPRVQVQVARISERYACPSEPLRGARAGMARRMSESLRTPLARARAGRLGGSSSSSGGGR